MKLSGLIFDLDGTLADTQLDFSLIRAEAGVPKDYPILEYCDSLNCVQSKEHILNIVRKHELKGAEVASWIKDAKFALKQFQEYKIPIAILTRNMKQAAGRVVERLSIPIDLIITREDFPAKPDPTALLWIAQHWQISPSQLAYVGDYTFDIQVAKNAGMTSILLANDRNTIFHQDADILIHQFKELISLI